MNEKDLSKYLSVILELLKTMTQSGADIHRVEESAQRIFTAYGIPNVDVYATTSNLIISLETEDHTISTHTRRIGAISSDIERVHHLNALARSITENRPTPQEIRDALDKIKASPTYPSWIVVLSYGVIAGAFYFFFGGRSIPEAFYSTVIGFVSGILTKLSGKLGVNKFFLKFCCSFLACAIALSLLRFHLVDHIDYMIIGNIMTLIPGVGLMNSLRDLFLEDSISGVQRLIEAALLALSIAGGYVAASFLFGGI